MSSVNEEYLVDWKNHPNNFPISFCDLLQGNKLVDVQLVAEGQLISAHRLVLSAMSPYFCNMFTQMPVSQQAFVFMKDISKRTMVDLITFIYRGEVSVKREYLDEFMNAAIALNIKGLADGSYSHSVESPPTTSTPVKPAFNGSTYQTSAFNHTFGSAGVQYQSVQRSAQSTPYQQRMNEYQKQDGFNFVEQNPMDDGFGYYESNNDQNSIDEDTSDNYSMNEYGDESFDQKNGDSDSNDNELETMATAPKRFKTIKTPEEYDIVADIRVINDRDCLFHHIYTFGKHVKPNNKGQQRWRCTKAHSQKCRAAMSTMNVDGVTMMKTLIAEHTHE